MTSNTTLAPAVKTVTTIGKSVATKQSTSVENIRRLTMEELRNLDFELFNGSTRFSWSPKAAFDARETGEVGPDGEYETLYDYLTKSEYSGIAAQTLLEVNHRLVPKADALITVYRAADKDCGADYGVILPGASVTESKAYAKRHADLYMSGQHKLMETMVYPDELVTRGDSHEFTYVPRSLQVGYDRYAADVARAMANV